VDNYLEKPEQNFTEVKVLIYVFEVNFVETDELETFQKVVEQLEKYSPDAKLFILIHKMDTIAPVKKQEVMKEKQALINEYAGQIVEVQEFFATSIWDVTLYNVGLADIGLEQDHPDPHPQPQVPQPVAAADLRSHPVRRDHPLRKVDFPHNRLLRERERPQEHPKVRAHLHHRQALQAVLQQDRHRDLEHVHPEPQLPRSHRRLHLEHLHPPHLAQQEHQECRPLAEHRLRAHLLQEKLRPRREHPL
jgi:hypothetical protein